MSDYRASYGNGQVGPTRKSYDAALDDLHADVDGYNGYGCVQRYEPGSADAPGDWFKCARNPRARDRL